ncbi:MAG: L-threonylcarbamoyladenylate synthase [Alphaproteobacteria bacterium]|nr:L-threonylcarbamoyladenylate synthase [Alphaproteobacteria bacterium]
MPNTLISEYLMQNNPSPSSCGLTMESMEDDKETSFPEITQAVTLLSQGNVVVMPTETVYGLAADATNGLAIAKIYEIKSRPQFNPLIVHVHSLEAAQLYADFTDDALAIAAQFWTPGPNHRPLTLVLNKKQGAPISELATAGLDTIAIRIPGHPIALQLLAAFEKPLAAPSANISNSLSTTTAQAAHHQLGDKVPLILDGGPCAVGVESTILDLSGENPVLLRPGGTTTEELEIALGKHIQRHAPSAAIKAPGMMKRHYSPSLPLRLNADTSHRGEAFIGFGPDSPKDIAANLSPSGNLAEAAANLFETLRCVDRADHYSGIAIMPIPEQGLGIAINDRLARAAS